jgi:glyoxylase-like metal-dependent hydrolase (beta-lactamase superfamily II)
MAPGEDVPAQLRSRSIDPADVRLVVMTHLHADHTSAMSEFGAATFVTTPQEWDAARGRLGALSGYLRGHLPARDRMRLEDVAAGAPYEGLAHTVDLLGDGTLRLVWSPGHTAGHVAVLVATDDGPVFVLGDAVYTLRNLHDDVLPFRMDDDDAARATMRELRAFAASHPDVPLIPTHDPDLWPA